MKILHLFSDWKWTGPSDPVLNLCRALERKGHDVTLAYRKPPYPAEESLEEKVLASGIKATNQFCLDHALKLSRPWSLGYAFRDLFNLRNYLRRQKFEILNVHQSHDHVLGGIAAKGTEGPVLVIRTDHKRDFLKPSWGNRVLISKMTDGVITFSEKARREDASNFRLPMERVVRIPPALDLERLDPKKTYQDMKSFFGIEPGEVVIGMVARFQKYRRTEAFLEAVRDIVREFPRIRVLLVGRSGQMDESVVRPMKRLGVEPWVILAGYRKEDYLDTLACMDIFVFLMAGSDGTARALREAMAMGKAVVVADRGMLPELVEDGVSGLVVQDTPEALARATLQMLRKPELRRRMGEAALQKAHREFRLDRQAEEVEKFYEKIIALGKWGKL